MIIGPLYLDFSKAFDYVNYFLSPKQLELYKFSKNSVILLTYLLKAYIKERSLQEDLHCIVYWCNSNKKRLTDNYLQGT